MVGHLWPLIAMSRISCATTPRHAPLHLLSGVHVHEVRTGRYATGGFHHSQRNKPACSTRTPSPSAPTLSRLPRPPPCPQDVRALLHRISSFIQGNMEALCDAWAALCRTSSGRLEPFGLGAFLRRLVPGLSHREQHFLIMHVAGGARRACQPARVVVGLLGA